MNTTDRTCDGVKDCPNAATHVSSKWIYCQSCAIRFGGSRQLRKWEIDRLSQGKTVLYERLSKAEFLRRYPEQK